MTSLSQILRRVAVATLPLTLTLAVGSVGHASVIGGFSLSSSPTNSTYTNLTESALNTPPAANQFSNAFGADTAPGTNPTSVNISGAIINLNSLQDWTVTLNSGNSIAHDYAFTVSALNSTAAGQNLQWANFSLIGAPAGVVFNPVPFNPSLAFQSPTLLSFDPGTAPGNTETFKFSVHVPAAATGIFHFQLAVTPEPASLMLATVVAALGGFGLRRRKRAAELPAQPACDLPA